MSVKLTRVGERIEVGEPRLLFRYPPDVEWSDFTHDGQRMLVTISSGGARNRRARVILRRYSLPSPFCWCACFLARSLSRS